MLFSRGYLYRLALLVVTGYCPGRERMQPDGAHPGCQLALLRDSRRLQAGPVARSKDVDSRYYSIPAGSSLILHQDVKYPAGRAHVDIQHGRVVPALDNWAVGCELELRKLGPGVVTADTFTVRRAEVSQRMG